MLPKKAIGEFKRLCKRIYGIDMTDAEAQCRADNLVRLYNAVLRGKQRGRSIITDANTHDRNTNTTGIDITNIRSIVLWRAKGKKKSRKDDDENSHS